MEVSVSTFFVCFMAMETYACGLRLPRQFVAPGFNNQNEENSKLEDVLDLSRPALHTLLKGLAALLVQLYPDIAPKPPTVPPSPPSKEKKEEEPIKIFRQIMQIPGPIYPPVQPEYPCQPMCGHQMQNHQANRIQQDPCPNLQDPSRSFQMSQQVPEMQMPQTTQVTEHCYPSSTCCQQNPFSPHQFNLNAC